ncbi:MAG: RagB/SusD family nutrient uptake outer membrane protein [Paludibacter sp.]|nr:RagB/SusD family nutrient uptake outer membrane protein [Paludibacter sp.]
MTGILLCSTLLVSCDGLLNVDSKRLTTDEEYGLKSASDSIYSMFGLYSQLQKIADSYVLLGELRGDLMDVTATSDPDLREINSFNISKTNKYVNIKNYYAIVNHCNYIIHHLDTSAVDRGQQLKLRQYAAVKAIRAWTYMQIANNFKEVKYYTKPILTVADASKTYPKLTLTELSDSLIADLEPLKKVDMPYLGYVDAYNTTFSIFPVRFVLGDLYLWKGEYQKAAIEYRELIFEKRIVIEKNNYSYWVPVNNTISSNAFLYWTRALTLGSGEVITTIMCPTEYGQNYYLDSLNN